MMDLQHLNVKIMADLNGVEPDTLIPIFHKWIQMKVTKEMLVDVADYLHVPEGPGVLLVGHEAFMSLDHGENRWGFLYNRRAALNGGIQDRLQSVTRAALEHCKRLEEEEALRGKLKFRGEEIQLAVNDRLLAPNTEETFKALEPEIKTFLGKLYGGASCTCKRHTDPRERLTLDVKARDPFPVVALLKNLA
jgi:hypothetical protein